MSSAAYADSYKWVDKNGVLHFSDRPAGEAVKGRQGGKGANPGKRSQEEVKFYDMRERVVGIVNNGAIKLESGKIVKYIGVKDPFGFLVKEGKAGRVKETRRFHRRLVLGKIVTVLLGKKPKDRAGNYLGHVFLGRDIFVNAELIQKGYAVTEAFPADFEYQSLFIRLLEDAQKKKAGIWGF